VEFQERVSVRKQFPDELADPLWEVVASTLSSGPDDGAGSSDSEFNRHLLKFCERLNPSFFQEFEFEEDLLQQVFERIVTRFWCGQGRNGGWWRGGGKQLFLRNCEGSFAGDADRADPGGEFQTRDR
jgi:hypothetical protein